MSPEQLLGKPIDARSDLFSLGVVLYEMVTGRLPFAGQHARRRRRTRSSTSRRATSATAPMPERLKAAIRKLLEKDREKRYPSAEAVRAGSSPRIGASPRSPAGALGRRGWIAAAAAVAVLAPRSASAGSGIAARAMRWVQTTAIPEITRLVAAEDFPKAAALIREARAVDPEGPDAREALDPVDDRGLVESDPAGRGRLLPAVPRRPERVERPRQDAPRRTCASRRTSTSGASRRRASRPRSRSSRRGRSSTESPTRSRPGSIPPASVPAGMMRVAGGKFQPFIPGLALAGGRRSTTS